MQRLSIKLLFITASLMILPACNSFKGKDGSNCESCSSSAVSGTTDNSQAILYIDEKPVMTAQDFDDFFEDLINSEPRAAAFIALYPNAKAELFKNQRVPSAVIQEWAKRTGKTSEADYQKKLQKAKARLEEALATTAFEETILKEIDTAVDTLKSFYEENKGKAEILNQPPFLKAAAGVTAISAEFDNEKAANDFAKKAQAPNANFNELAKAANKDVKDLGVVSAQSRNVEPALRVQVPNMEAGKVEVIALGKDKFDVVKAIEKKSPEFAPFEEVQDMVKQALLQSKAAEKFQEKLDALKKEYNVRENEEYFKKDNSKGANLAESLGFGDEQDSEQEAQIEPNLGQNTNQLT